MYNCNRGVIPLELIALVLSFLPTDRLVVLLLFGFKPCAKYLPYVNIDTHNLDEWHQYRIDIAYAALKMVPLCNVLLYSGDVTPVRRKIERMTKLQKAVLTGQSLSCITLPLPQSLVILDKRMHIGGQIPSLPNLRVFRSSTIHLGTDSIGTTAPKLKILDIYVNRSRASGRLIHHLNLKDCNLERLMLHSVIKWTRPDVVRITGLLSKPNEVKYMNVRVTGAYCK